MTPTDLDALDRRCAVEIMGWKGERHSSIEDVVYYPQGDMPDLMSGSDVPTQYKQWLWQPTRNIAQAWDVLEKIEDVVKLERGPDGETDWLCEITGYQVYRKIATTAALAIVLAALAAKGNKDG